MSDEFARGASASIQKTMAEIDAILDGTELPKVGALREKLRAKLLEVLTDSAKEWVQHGFEGGHNISAQHFARTGSFPRRISKSIKRNMPVHKVSPTVHEMVLKSKLLKKYAEALDE